MGNVGSKDFRSIKDSSSEAIYNFIPFHETCFNEDSILAMSVLTVLLERRNILIKELKRYNEIFLENRSKYNEEFRQKYAWTVLITLYFY